MTIRPACGLLALCLALPCRAGDRSPWTTQDTLWELGYAATVAMDCSQSRQIENGGYERNPLLPRHPSAKTITQLCVLNVIAHVGISYVLKTPWRRRFQVATVVIEAGVVADNYYRAGVKLKF